MAEQLDILSIATAISDSRWGTQLQGDFNLLDSCEHRLLTKVFAVSYTRALRPTG